MAKIPIFTPDFRTFTQVYPYMQTENELAARDTSGKLLPMSYNRTADIYIDVTKIISVGGFFDTQINEFSNECRSLIVSGVAIPIYVTDSYASIKTILDGIDCNDLCSDS
tara:strand:+ start:22210 stop:22539 length:330 start_codon:yes stop_codon:yes gene_type:complete